MDFQTVFSTLCAVVIATYGLYKGIAEIHEHTEAGKRKREKKEKEEELKWEDRVTKVITEVTRPMHDSIEEIKEMTFSQQEEINDIKNMAYKNQQSQMDLMRAKMNTIYYKYLPYKKILDYDKKAFLRIYQDYREQGGNTWIVDLHDQLVTWETVRDRGELHQSEEEFSEKD